MYFDAHTGRYARHVLCTSLHAQDVTFDSSYCTLVHAQDVTLERSYALRCMQKMLC